MTATHVFYAYEGGADGSYCYDILYMTATYVFYERYRYGGGGGGGYCYYIFSNIICTKHWSQLFDIKKPYQLLYYSQILCGIFSGCE